MYLRHGSVQQTVWLTAVNGSAFVDVYKTNGNHLQQLTTMRVTSLGLPEYTHRGASGFPLGVVRPECDEIRLRSPWVVSLAGVFYIASPPLRSGLRMILSWIFCNSA